jgi:anthranilate phosphoribosyltransferase
VHRFIKAVGAGAKRARALSREEAREAMALVAGGAAAPVQVGALLLALRMKGETADELAGFADALAPHTRAIAAPDGALDVDGHGDGHQGVPSLLPAAACAAAACGVPVCLGVDGASPFARHGLDGALAALGLGGALSPERAARDLARAGFAAWDLALACPPLAALMALRPLLGVRSVAQTLAKLVSPTGAARRLVGIVHAPYLEPTAAALGRLGVARGLAVQALGGLPEARPGRIARVAWSSLPRATSVDLRPFAADDAPPFSADAAAANRAALDGAAPFARAAAATAALMLHAATAADPVAAAEDALAALASGRARAVAERLA